MTTSIQLPTQEDIDQFRSNLLEWYYIYGRKFPWRKKGISTYRKIISEVLLQRSRAETISVFFPKFVTRFPSWASLAKAPVEEVENFLKPIGLWRRRASSLLLLAKEMVKRHGKFPIKREEIESLPGVGQYIANAVMMFANGEPQPLLDINMARLLERYFRPRTLVDIRYDSYLQQLAKNVVDCDDYMDLNWAILDLASIICRPQVMHHERCCLNRKCTYYQNLLIAIDSNN